MNHHTHRAQDHLAQNTQISLLTIAQSQPTLRELNDMFHQFQTPTSPSLPRENLPPYHDLAQQIIHLSLGPYSTRTLPLSSLPLFTSLVSLSIPRELFLSPSIEPSNFSPSLRAIRITPERTRSDEREDLRNGQDETGRTKRWEQALEKARRIFDPTLTEGRTSRPRGLRLLELNPLGRSSGRREEGVTRVSSSFSVGFVPKEEVRPLLATQVDSNLGESLLWYEYGPSSPSLGDKDGSWELGHEQWRESLFERGFLRSW